MKHAPPLGFEQVPPGGMCVCAYLFVTRRDQLLLGKYADDPQWEALAGLEPERRRTHGWGWTVPAPTYARGHEDVVARWLATKSNVVATGTKAAARQDSKRAVSIPRGRKS